jgi:hypothetical protein
VVDEAGKEPAAGVEWGGERHPQETSLEG